MTERMTFNPFLPAEFILADQLWCAEQWEALCTSPFPPLASPLLPFAPGDLTPPAPPEPEQQPDLFRA